MKPLILFLLVTLAFSYTSALAGEMPASEKLSKTPVFAFGGIGFAGTKSEGEIAFTQIFHAASAEDDFIRMLKTGNPQAKCYALVGLRLKNRGLFAEQVRSFLSSKEQVQTASGCIWMKVTLSSVAAGIQRGNYDERVLTKPNPR